MSKKTRALNKEEYRLIIDCIKKGFDMPGGTAVRRHIVGGANRTLFSVDLPPRLCRTGT